MAEATLETFRGGGKFLGKPTPVEIHDDVPYLAVGSSPS